MCEPHIVWSSGSDEHPKSLGLSQICSSEVLKLQLLFKEASVLQAEFHCIVLNFCTVGGGEKFHQPYIFSVRKSKTPDLFYIENVAKRLHLQNCIANQNLKKKNSNSVQSWQKFSPVVGMLMFLHFCFDPRWQLKNYHRLKRKQFFWLVFCFFF